MIILWMLFAYLIGSISTAVLYCRFTGLSDPRKEGSGNPGATNVLRLGGKKAAIIVLLGDVLKGIIPVGLASIAGLEAFALGIVALAAVIGHIFPFFFRFKGGKGVATAFGCLLVLSWPLAILLLLTWLIVAFVWKYSSLAAIVTVSLAPFYNLFFFDASTFPIILISALLLWRHRENIQRLLDGTESKINV